MSERRRVRLKVMAKELGISDRKLRALCPLGLPHTQMGEGLLWFEPDLVHEWLDKYNRAGRALGIKRTRGSGTKWQPISRMPLAIGWQPEFY